MLKFTIDNIGPLYGSVCIEAPLGRITNVPLDIGKTTVAKMIYVLSYAASENLQDDAIERILHGVFGYTRALIHNNHYDSGGHVCCSGNAYPLDTLSLRITPSADCVMSERPSITVSSNVTTKLGKVWYIDATTDPFDMYRNHFKGVSSIYAKAMNRIHYYLLREQPRPLCNVNNSVGHIAPLPGMLDNSVVSFQHYSSQGEMFHLEQVRNSHKPVLFLDLMYRTVLNSGDILIIDDIDSATPEFNTLLNFISKSLQLYIICT